MSEQLRTAAQAALEALEEIMGDYDLGCGRVQARALRAALAEPQPELAEFVLVPREPTPEMVGAMAVEESTGTINGISTLGMAGACLAWESALAAAPKAQQPQPEPVAGKTPHFTIMWTICRFALAYPTEVLLHQIGRFSEVLEGNEQQSIRSLLIRAQNQKPQVPCIPLVPSAAPQAQRPQPEPVALRAALMRLADAADRVGVEHFDSDSLPPAVDLLNTETRAVHTLLKQSAGPQPEPVAHIDLVQNPMRPSYFIAGAADEHPAEQVLRALACWLGVGGYNAQTVDAKVFHRKIVDGVEQLMKSRAAPQVQHPLTDEQINQCISADKAFWHTAAKETGWSFGPNLHDFARAIEAAHGIGGK